MRNKIFVDGREMSIAKFEAASGLIVSGSLDLCGTKIKPIGQDRRGYEFFAVRLSNGPRVIAGCRNFSPEEARAHWKEGTECRELAEKCIAILEKGD